MTRSKGRGSLGRKGPSRDALARVVVLCEGRNTEPQYIREFVRERRSPLISVEVIGPVGVPMTLIQEARRFQKGIKEEKSSFSKLDKVFVVFDCDEHPRRKEAIEEARKHSIGVAYSDPCFELWGILHYRDFDSPLDRVKMQKAFEAECGKYSRKSGKIVSYDLLRDGFEDACNRADAMRRRRLKDGGECPYTDVDLLLKYIEKSSSRKS